MAISLRSPALIRRRSLRIEYWWSAMAETAAAWGRRLQLWQERVQRRSRLSKLDDRRLAELGLTRAQVIRELEKPFWRP